MDGFSAPSLETCAPSRRSLECTVFPREMQETTTAGSHPNSAIDPASESWSMSTTSERRRENGNREDADVRALIERAGAVVGRSSAMAKVQAVRSKVNAIRRRSASMANGELSKRYEGRSRNAVPALKMNSVQTSKK